MCYTLRLSRVMRCIPVEAICFFHGIINCVLSIFGVVTLSLARIILDPGEVFVDSINNSGFQDGYDLSPDNPMNAYPELAAFPLTAYGLVLYAFCFGSFIFSLLLCYGIHKRSPAYLKAYLAYGVVITTLMIATLFYLFAWLTDHITHAVTIMGIVFCMYLGVLRMVQQTYQLFCSEQRHLLPHHEDFMKHS
ncbi:uncharacterized protein LOC125235316 isoform X2 [Leguminivora glycinivorella]|uniref:uncharacterized protein LOC125235316 isoform X2 n=1 Tax=Leguminivora glycinivorella TaxID=1035111 RepID=UPI00200E3D5D|nr:uncharacterized protein LOC125235316 isoform X2 [Leguminivora glycinivorella]